MRILYKQLLDGQISRRDFAKELAVLGVSVGSVSSLLASVANAAVAESDAAKPGRVHSIFRPPPESRIGFSMLPEQGFRL